MEEFEEKLLKLYGPILLGIDLRKSLGYRSVTAFNTAVRTNIIGVNIFEIAGRKGKFALTTDVARWLIKLSLKDQLINQQGGVGESGNNSTNY